ncbi:MAG: calcium-binding protein [Acidimicrobiia bacterium]
MLEQGTNRMSRRWSTAGRALTVVLMVGAMLFPVVSVGAAVTLVVDGDGFGTAANCDEGVTVAFTSIQAAIDVAVAGDTVFVCPGTYDERLDIDVQITLTGSGIGSTIVQPSFAPPGGGHGANADVDIDDAADGTIIESISFDFNGAADNRGGWGILISDLAGPDVTDVTIRNNDIQMGVGAGAAGAGQGLGITTGKDANVGGLVISGNAFHGDPTDTGSGAANGAEAIYINPNTSGSVTISGNTFDQHLFVGISVESDDVTVVGNTVASTIAPQTAGTNGIRVNDFVGSRAWSNIVIADNIVAGFENGLRLGPSSTASSGIAVSVTGNTFSDNTTAIRIRQDIDATANHNSIAGTSLTTGVVVEAGAPSADAECNWWGDATGPSGDGSGSGSTVSPGADFTPWLTTDDLYELCISETVGTGESLTTDFDADGASSEVPVEVEVSIPVGGNAGPVTITETTGELVSGYTLFGTQVVITAPAQTATVPLVITFTLDASVIPAGTVDRAIVVFKDGVAVPGCVDTMASPDPCVASRTTLADPHAGDVEIIVRSSTASTWLFGTILRKCAGLVPTIVGTPFDDAIVGTTGDDVIWTAGGNDTVVSLAGNDTICLGPGDDIAYGGDGDDVIGGGSGVDVVYGDAGNDEIKGRGGPDTLYGGLGNDLLIGNAGGDTLYGHEGSDILRGALGADTLHGGAEGDLLRGGVGADALHGGEGNDKLQGGSGFDTGSGDAGTDTCGGVELASSC